MNASVEKIVGTSHVEGVLVDGETVPADLVLVEAARSQTPDLAEQAGTLSKERNSC